MKKLAADPGAVPVHGFRKFSITWNGVVGRRHQYVGGVARRLVDARYLDDDQPGAASGAYGTVQQVGAALGVAVIGTAFFSVVGPSYDAVSLRSGLVTACWIAAAGYALAAVASLVLPSRAQVRAHHAAVAAQLAADGQVTTGS